MATTWQPHDNQMSYQMATQVRLGKDRIGKDSVGNRDIGDSNESQPKRKQFKPPSVEEVREYCCERMNNVNAEAFVDFYESKGWMVGKNKMKDWKAAVRTWEKGKSDKKNNTYTSKTDAIQNRVSVVDSW